MEETGVPEETTDLRQVTDETFRTYGLCPVRGLNLGRRGVKQSELRHDESDALAHRATTVPKLKQLGIGHKKWGFKGTPPRVAVVQGSLNPES